MEKTLENPDITGAEGARVKPNLSGKRTERTIIKLSAIMSFKFRASAISRGFYILFLGGFFLCKHFLIRV